MPSGRRPTVRSGTPGLFTRDRFAVERTGPEFQRTQIAPVRHAEHGPLAASPRIIDPIVDRGAVAAPYMQTAHMDIPAPGRRGITLTTPSAAFDAPAAIITVRSVSFCCTKLPRSPCRRIMSFSRLYDAHSGTMNGFGRRGA